MTAKKKKKKKKPQQQACKQTNSKISGDFIKLHTRAHKKKKQLKNENENNEAV